MVTFDADGFEPHWFHERFPPRQIREWRNFQTRAVVRRVFFLIVLLLPLVPGLFFNLMLFGKKIDPFWVLLSIVPGVIALLGVLVMAGMFVQAVFGLQSREAAFQYALLCVFGRPRPLRYPFVLVAEGKVRKADRNKFAANRHLGGPGTLIIQNDSAVVLERYAQITRIEGPGFVFLDRFERIREVFDLRPQTRTIDATVYSKDGIAIRTKITVRFQIKCGQSTLETPYPVTQETLKQVANAEAWRVVNLGGEGHMNWIDRVMGVVEATLREIIAQRLLDQVYEPTDVSRDPRNEIGQAMLTQLRDRTANLGVHILDVMLGPFNPVERSVEEQRRAVWRAVRRAEDRVALAHGEADALLARETAYAYAQMEMMSAINRGMQNLTVDRESRAAHFIALRFIETLRRIAAKSGAGSFLPTETIRTLEFLNAQLSGRSSLPDSSSTGTTDTP